MQMAFRNQKMFSQELLMLNTSGIKVITNHWQLQVFCRSRINPNACETTLKDKSKNDSCQTTPKSIKTPTVYIVLECILHLHLPVHIVISHTKFNS